MSARVVPLRPAAPRSRALEVPAVIAPTVNLMRFSEALARGGLVGRHDAERGVLVIEDSQARCACGRPHCPGACLDSLGFEQVEDATAGVRWWNGLSKAERAHWLDRAWKRTAPAGRYTLESMPAAADAWAAFRAAQRCSECGGTGFDEDSRCDVCDGTGREGGTRD